MNIDIDLDDFRTQFEETRRNILTFHENGKANLKDYEASKKEFNALNSGLTLTEKIFGSSFGGDKVKLKRLQSLKERILKLRIDLKKIDENLKSENNKVRIKVVEHLSKNSNRFRKLTSDKHNNQQLLAETNSFSVLLKKAKGGIKDALIFTSWKGLLEHPKAQNELSKFNRFLDNLQSKINQYETQTGTQMINGKRLEDFIQFSTEKIAIESFNKLSGLLNEISTKVTGKNSEIEREMNSLTEKIHQSVLR